MESDAASPLPEAACALCGARGLTLVRRGNIPEPLAPGHFAVTDSRYGVTADIFRCPACGLMQCSALGDPQAFYAALSDPDYEAGRPQRALQMRRVLERLAPFCPRGRLLDVGAATGILVEEARARGYDAAGIEPSAAFCRVAQARGLPVCHGVFPHPQVPGPFDAVMLVDVLEHVADPVGLLRNAAAALAPGGVGVVVTPDAGSLAARLLGWRWWHFRVAHVMYFTRATLHRALAAAGCKPLQVCRPGWYFAGDYLCARLLRYLPGGRRLRAPAWLRRLTIPLNPRDSLLVVFTRAEEPAHA